MPEAVDVEIAQGRLWRAKEILRGRLASGGYDADLFARYADVLAAMGDADEAGRYGLLAGCLDGAHGERARAFLARRRSRPFAQLWSEMPAAARRGRVDDLPHGTLDLLGEAGFAPQQVRCELDRLKRRRHERQRWHILDHSPAALRRERRVALIVGAVLVVILSVGLIGTLRLIFGGVGWLASYF